MSKAVLASILPWWCLKIADGEKTVEIRKTKPDLPTPFKTYIYVPKKRPFLAWGDVFRGDWETEFTALYGYGWEEANRIWEVFNGNVMGEFVCDRIDWHGGSELIVKEDREMALAGSCLNREELFSYLGIAPGTSAFDKRAEFYGWSISQLEVYDSPVPLSAFHRPVGGNYCKKCGYMENGKCYHTPEAPKVRHCAIVRPPQAWMYVEVETC